MLFVSFGFVAIFLSVIFGVYCIFRNHVKLQNILLLCASIFFMHVLM
jgi:EamA domain-containing membrane protein RarD